MFKGSPETRLHTQPQRNHNSGIFTVLSTEIHINALWASITEVLLLFQTHPIICDGMEISFYQPFGSSSVNLQRALCYYPDHLSHNNAAAASVTVALLTWKMAVIAVDFIQLCTTPGLWLHISKLDK